MNPQLRLPMRALWLSLLLCTVPLSNSRAQLPEKSQTPDHTAVAFYKWYIGALDEGAAPLRSSPQKMSEFVSRPLLTQLAHRAMDEDYFLKTQDALDDW